MTRQIVLDTETTGLEPSEGHRIIEIGCVELVNRRLTGNDFHYYLQPDREIDQGAIDVHGITNEFLADKPRFRDIADEFVRYVRGAELVIHNAPFDVGFLNHEFALLGDGSESVDALCSVLDTLVMARRNYPGQRNSLDALCRRLEIDNSQREYHGALLDAQILAEVYLAMTGGQAALLLDAGRNAGAERKSAVRMDRSGLELVTRAPSGEESEEHRKLLETIKAATGGECLWQQ